jgi:4-hydroxybenzoate polyprenyltransferase/phosphoserine phosphatase
MDEKPLPLVVDLDGTLIQTDLLAEGVFRALASHPLRALKLLIPFWHHPEILKTRIAEMTSAEFAHLPWNEEVRGLIRARKAAGSEIVLATAASEKAALAVAKEPGDFSMVLGSNPARNLKGKKKADLLVEKFGERGFDYIGDSKADLAVWKSAARAYLASPSVAMLAWARKKDIALEPIGEPRPRWAFLKAVRIAQWTKNLLVFAPMLAHHGLPEGHSLVGLLLVFFAFCFLAGGTYLLNDLLDVADDRKHPRKRFRPLASGRLWIWSAIRLAMVCFGLAVLCAFAAPLQALPWLGVYAVLTAAYSLYLKRVPLLDIVCLVAFYALRIQAGAAASGIVISPWLFGFALAGFFSLSFFKRGRELELRELQKEIPSGRRSYQFVHRPALLQAGAASGYAGCLILALYSFSDNAASLYQQPRLFLGIAFLCAVGTWHFWTKPRAGQADDPLLAVFSDWRLLLIGAAMFCLLWLAV